MPFELIVNTPPGGFVLFGVGFVPYVVPGGTSSFVATEPFISTFTYVMLTSGSGTNGFTKIYNVALAHAAGV